MSATSPADLSALTAVSPVDGRYGDKTAPLRAHFSELFVKFIEVTTLFSKT
jgi:hypothetical protein